MRPTRLLLWLLAGLAPAASLAAQVRLLQAGPMVGYSEMREVMLWAQTTAPARVKFVYWDSTAPRVRLETAEYQTRAEEAYTARLVADRVEPGRGYHYELHLNGQRVDRPWPLRFQTQALWQWRTDPPAFRFVLASCFYVNDPPYDRPGAPYGGEFEILAQITARNPDFMLWLGDNVYLREADWYTRTGIFYRYTHTRSLPELQPVLGGMHHYAIWDDHDYGPNDSDRSYRDKELTLETFTLFWGNRTYGIPGAGGGITSRFEWQDVEFFLLDDRWFRSPNARSTGVRTLLGEDQREWLIDALASSRAPFKFVVMGGQVLNPVARWESYATFPEEREWLLRRLAEEGIPGVMFLTGDVHHTLLTRLERQGTYPLYDLTISPLTAGVATGVNPEAPNPNHLLVPGTLLVERNFATIDVSGPRTDRRMTITVIDSSGRERWTRTIAASELR